MSTIWKGLFKVLNLYVKSFFDFIQIVKGPRGDPGPKGPPVSFLVLCKNIFNSVPYSTGKEGR